MTGALVVVSLLLAAMVYIAIRGQVSMVQERERADGLAAEVAARDHLIARLREVANEANARKDNMASGTSGDRFDASLDVLHDIATTTGGGVAGVPRPGGESATGR